MTPAEQPELPIYEATRAALSARNDITAAYHRGNPESAAARTSIADSADLLRARVVAHIDRCGPTGATSDEVEMALAMPHQTVSARITEGKARGLLVTAGSRRPTRSGRGAAVIVTPRHAAGGPL